MTADSRRNSRREVFTPADQTRNMSTNQQEKTSMAVVLAIAEKLDVDPVDLEPLAKSIDPGALDRLFDRSDGAMPELSFEHAGVSVRIDSGGVHVR